MRCTRYEIAQSSSREPRRALAGRPPIILRGKAPGLASLPVIARRCGGPKRVERLGAKAVVVAADVADAGAIFAAATEIEEHHGPIDIWVNNAMVTVFGPLWSLSPDEFRRVTEVTYLGVVHGTMAALRSMRPRNQGHIIQVGSALAYRGIPLQAAYCGASTPSGA